ncbi:unnamed protein product [Absidia cylindrospora]
MTMTTIFKVLKQEILRLQQTLDSWPHIEPEGLALKKLCQLLQESDDNITKLAAVDKANDVSLIFKDTIVSVEEFIERDREGQDLWGNMLWKTRRDLLLSQFRLTWQDILFDQLNPLVEKALSRPFPFYYEIEHFKNDMIKDDKDEVGAGSYQYYQHLFKRNAKPSAMWTTFMERYQAQFGPWDDITRNCLSYLVCTDNHGREMSIYSYIAITREYGFPLDMEKLPLTMLSPPPAPSEQARVETAKMVMDLITEFSTLEMRNHLVALYTWFKDCKDKRDKNQKQERSNEWAQVMLSARGKPSINEWTDEEKQAERVDLARRAISLFYQRYMVMWRMGQFARDLFTDVDFPGKGRIYEMKENVLPLDHANFHLIIRGDATKWNSKRPKVYKFLDQVIKQT